MGCGFSSPQLQGQSNNGLATYEFNGIGPLATDKFGVGGHFTDVAASIFNPSLSATCSATGSVGVYLTVPGGSVVTCNTLTLTASGSILCPIAKTAIPAGTATLSFSPINGATSVQQIFFDVVIPSTTTNMATTCTPPPTSCAADNCYRALANSGKAGSAYCSTYLTTAVASTPSNVANGCKSNEGRISSACYCLDFATCKSDNCLRAFQHSSTVASSFCSTFTQPGAMAMITPSFATASCSNDNSRISSACSCLATPAPAPAVLKRESLFGRLVAPFDIDLDKVTEVNVIVKRKPGYSGPDATVTSGTIETITVMTTSTILGSPTCAQLTTV